MTMTLKTLIGDACSEVQGEALRRHWPEDPEILTTV